MSNNNKEPTWLVLKKAAAELTRKGLKTFTRRELITYAKKYIDPNRPASILDFEVDLVTVNGSSKDKYRDPEKLFLFRIGRGKYTVYDPELHGPIDKYIEMTTKHPARRVVVKSIVDELRARGYQVDEIKGISRATAPDLVAKRGNEKIGVWIIDPIGDQRAQMRTLAYSLGSAIVESKNYSWVLVLVPPPLLTHLQPNIRSVLETIRVKVAVIREERRYTIKL